MRVLLDTNIIIEFWKQREPVVSAVIALHYDLPFYPFNRKDFRYIAGLTLHEPVQA